MPVPPLISSLYLKADAGVLKTASLLTHPFLLLVRLYWGWQFFVTGKGKLTNLDATAEFFASLNLPLPKLQAILAGSTECFGGLLLLVGLFSRFISIPLMFTMVVAYLTAHLDVVQTIWSDSDSFVTAPPFLFLMASVVIFIFGPGAFSLDALIFRKHRASS